MRTYSCIPEPYWRSAVSDEMFAAAYEAVSEKNRGVLKKLIAQLHSRSDASSLMTEMSVREYAQGFTCRVSSRPSSWAILSLDQNFNSPCQLLAAVMPCISHLIPKIAVFGAGSVFQTTPSLLTALELAGIETVFSSGQPEWVGDLLQSATEEGPGVLIGLGETGFLQYCCSVRPNQDVPFVPLNTVTRLGVWAEEDLWDTDILRFAHPGAEITWFGPKPDDFSPTVHEPLDQDRFFRSHFHAVYVPEGMVDQTLEHFNLVLCPGQEGSWFWPSLKETVLRAERFAWTGSGRKYDPGFF
ncbi:MAG: hypothetical protein ACOC0U_04880 [Desulfovibrionales bacterium]